MADPDMGDPASRLHGDGRLRCYHVYVYFRLNVSLLALVQVRDGVWSRLRFNQCFRQSDGIDGSLVRAAHSMVGKNRPVRGGARV